MLSGYDQFLVKLGVVNKKHIFSEWPGELEDIYESLGGFSFLRNLGWSETTL